MMRYPLLMLALVLGSGTAAAQAPAERPDPASTGPAARVQGESDVTAGFSAGTRAALAAQVRQAADAGLPAGVLLDLIAEGRAKGAAERAVLTAVTNTRAGLEVSREALRRGGRAEPSGEEIAAGARAMAQGASKAELEALVRHEPSERRLTVALDVLTDLAARGMPVGRALAVVEARLAGTEPPASAALTARGTVEAGATLARPAGAVQGTVGAAAGVGLGRRP